ncbi:ribonuclease P protein subunit p25-like protein [Thrips palmi]|uniref:Ribonuclease P protein subunit p25-like protein n=1 Tax=Thrips palmi TaxID=161013 RepID=A0A6P8ZNK0_THRPL|nr:ribonuclease P protein subunit p25-like protein [Thrips palmi]
MENYRKGKNVEEEITKERIPIPGLPDDFIWMQVNGGSKIRNLLDVALKGFVEKGVIVWTGSGTAISKTISCAEILKRKHKAHQITKICYRKFEEYWEPLLPELDELVVVRDEPIIHILLSKNLLNTQEPGYQAPGAIDPSFKVQYDKQASSSRNPNNKNRNKPYTSKAPGQRSQPLQSQKNSQTQSQQ